MKPYIHWMKRHVGIIVGVAVGVTLIGVFVYRYREMSRTITTLDPDPVKREAQVKKEVEGYVKKISAIMVLPTGMPTVATVADAEKLKNQPFFSQSMDGDKVLIYTDIKRAILYRPSTGKVIDVTTLVENQPTLISPTPSAMPRYTFALWNGTTLSGLAKRYESVLKEKIASADVVNAGNAKGQDYQKTVIIDMKGDKKDVLTSLATALDISTASFPHTEATPSSKPDFLIILGNDQKK